MSKGRFYTFPQSVSLELEQHNSLITIDENNKTNDDNDDDAEFLQEVPYSSSSVDRSSIGSIPWADDAIKKNQLDWEHVERMLSGEDELPTEPDLRKEILEWQKKFPFLQNDQKNSNNIMKILPLQQQSFDSTNGHAPQSNSLEADLISNLSLNSADNDEDNDQYDVLATPTAPFQHSSIIPENPLGALRSENERLMGRLSAKLSFLRISALPLRTNQRGSGTNRELPLQSSTEREQSDSSNSMLPHKKIAAGKVLHIQPASPLRTKVGEINTRTRLRMPPILNVLESKRRFRDLANNKSFVQLTHVKVPQAKSAAIIRQPDSALPSGHTQPRIAPVASGHYQAAWHKPLMAARISNNFFNNRNAIILPALNLQRNSGQQRQPNRTAFALAATGGTQSHSLSNSTHESSASSGGVPLDVTRQVPNRYVPRWHQFNGITTSTSTGTVSTGRSISAAVHHPRHDFNELYAPYNMYKGDGLK